ncbi:unnamed protein product [Fraxinus pennsylvanica]|uniref:Uncharacterized protein n=1 Tax=Fraxinus pennsylvanica TaxID=56036 RepID=A0AAD2AAU9_9LAMI|nr:unnamed protein product [Fraxinus pennsylvanica]
MNAYVMIIRFFRLYYMGQNKSFHLILFIFLQFCSSIHCYKSTFDDDLAAILHDHVYKALINERPHTGALHNASLPANFAGIKVSAVGLRSKTLWRKGANFTGFHIPPKSLPVPYVRRILIVYHNLGNWSSLYYNLSGYSLISPVVGFMVYDASHLSNRNKNISKLELNTRGKSISIEFHSSMVDKGTQERVKCAAFDAYGKVFLSEMNLPNMCYSKTQGHFLIVIPNKNKQKVWVLWVIGFLFGLLGLILVGLAATLVAKSVADKRTQEMEKEADDGEFLDTYWIDSSKMPRAAVTRTSPVLESTILPRWSWYG